MKTYFYLTGDFKIQYTHHKDGAPRGMHICYADIDKDDAEDMKYAFQVAINQARVLFDHRVAELKNKELN